MVEQRTLTPLVLVRVQVPQPLTSRWFSTAFLFSRIEEKLSVFRRVNAGSMKTKAFPFKLSLQKQVWFFFKTTSNRKFRPLRLYYRLSLIRFCDWLLFIAPESLLTPSPKTPLNNFILLLTFFTKAHCAQTERRSHDRIQTSFDPARCRRLYRHDDRHACRVAMHAPLRNSPHRSRQTDQIP